MYRFVLLTLVLTTSFLPVWSQERRGFELSGDIKGLTDNSIVYLLTYEMDTVLSAKTKGSQFLMKGFVKGETNFFFLGIDTSFGRNLSNALWLVNDTMTLTGNVDSFNTVKLAGSAPHKDYMGIIEIQKDTNRPRMLANMKEYIFAHGNSLYIPRAIINMFRSLSSEGVQKAYGLLSAEAKSTYWGEELTKRLNSDTSAIVIGVGKKMDDFMVTDEEGKKVSILQLVSRSEYTLIDFWASWCSPCRAAIPDMKRTYEQFRSKGFGIIGVSIDTNEEKWKKAMKEDLAPWVQVIDNIGRVNKSRLGLKGIPGYVLLDREGKIISFSLLSQTTIGENDPKLPREVDIVLKQLYN